MMLSTRTSLRNIRPRKDCSVEATEREEEEAMSSSNVSSRSLKPKFFGDKSPLLQGFKKQFSTNLSKSNFDATAQAAKDISQKIPLDSASIQQVRLTQYKFIPQEQKKKKKVIFRTTGTSVISSSNNEITSSTPISGTPSKFVRFQAGCGPLNETISQNQVNNSSVSRIDAQIYRTTGTMGSHHVPRIQKVSQLALIACVARRSQFSRDNSLRQEVLKGKANCRTASKSNSVFSSGRESIPPPHHQKPKNHAFFSKLTKKLKLTSNEQEIVECCLSESSKEWPPRTQTTPSRGTSVSPFNNPEREASRFVRLMFQKSLKVEVKDKLV